MKRAPLIPWVLAFLALTALLGRARGFERLGRVAGVASIGLGVVWMLG